MKKLLSLMVIPLGLAGASGCAIDEGAADETEISDDGKSDNAEIVSGNIAHEWMLLATQLVREEKVPPPLAARIYGYVGLALHESAQAGRRGTANRSFAQELEGLEAIPLPATGTHKVGISVAQATSKVLSQFFTNANGVTKIDALLQKHLAASKTSTANSRRSVAFGDAVAAALIARAKTDGFDATRGKPFTPPVGLGKWVPTGPVIAPLEPFWGTLKTLSSTTTAADCMAEVGPPVAFSTSKTSAMFAQAKATFDAVNNGTAEEEEIAFYWADSPGLTSTPPGHWMEIAAQEGKRAGQSMSKATEMYALLGVAEMDAFITGWKFKYTFNLMRPQTYIQQNIDASWKPRLATPPFPEYISGHSVGSGAAASVLTHVFGSDHAFKDNTRKDTKISDAGGGTHVLGSRSFASFEAAAQEAAQSRLFGGIHYPMGSDKGLEAGECVASKLLQAVK
jgi:PAP2 superfamily